MEGEGGERMDKIKMYSGHCIAQDCPYSFTVTYLDAGDGTYIKGLMDCKYRGLHQPDICRDCTIKKQITETP